MDTISNELANYRQMLESVELKLAGSMSSSTSVSRDELIRLKHDLTELIQLSSKDNMLKVNSRKSSRAPILHSTISIDDSSSESNDLEITRESASDCELVTCSTPSREHSSSLAAVIPLQNSHARERPDVPPPALDRVHSASSSYKSNSLSLEREPACAALVDALVGAKCRVPYRTLSGRTLALNALVHAVEIERGTARVMLLTPPERRAVPCPRFLSDSCPLNDPAAALPTAIALSSDSSDSESESKVECDARDDNDEDSEHDVEVADACPFSHGVRVPIEDLVPFVAPDFSRVCPTAPVLVRSPLASIVTPSQAAAPAPASASSSSIALVADHTTAGEECAIWLPGLIRTVDSLTRDVEVELDDSAQLLSDERVRRVPLHHVFPLVDSPETNSDDDVIEISSSRISPKPTSKQPAIPNSWEQHTRGMGSKLMAKMGYKPGEPLGRSGTGIVEPIAVQILPAGLSLDALARMKERAGDPNLFTLSTRPVASHPPFRHAHSHGFGRGHRRGRETDPLTAYSSAEDSESEESSRSRARHSLVGPKHAAQSRVRERSSGEPPGAPSSASASSNLFDFLNRTVAAPGSHRDSRHGVSHAGRASKRARIALRTHPRDQLVASAAAGEDLTQLSDFELNRRIQHFSRTIESLTVKRARDKTSSEISSFRTSAISHRDTSDAHHNEQLSDPRLSHLEASRAAAQRQIERRQLHRKLTRF